jgi:alpha-D-ribose 1-methylphosphonate 5-triphosphate synthase subunit PhnI
MQAQIEQSVGLALRAGMSRRDALKAFDKALVVEALRRAHGNLCKAARLLHIHRNSLSRTVDIFDLTSLPAMLRRRYRQERFSFMLGKKPVGIWVDAPRQAERRRA